MHYSHNMQEQKGIKKIVLESHNNALFCHQIPILTQESHLFEIEMATLVFWTSKASNLSTTDHTYVTVILFIVL